MWPKTWSNTGTGSRTCMILARCEVKHGVRIRVVNLYTEELGNPEVPEKFKAASEAPSSRDEEIRDRNTSL